MYEKSGHSGEYATVPWFRLPGEPAPVERGRPVGAGPAITLGGVGQAWRALVEIVGDHIDGWERVWALEAGAGYCTVFDLPEDAYIVGVDRDAKALERNVRLDERVVADLSDYVPWAASFDLITCWHGLDDTVGAATVLDRFATWTAPGGLVVLAAHNPRSPLRLAHGLRRRAGLRGLRPAALCRRYAARGFTQVFQAYYEDAGQSEWRHRLGITHGLWKAAQVAVRVLSLGQLDAARTDYVAVFRCDERWSLSTGGPDS